MFHVDSKTGKTGECSATVRSCPYGGPMNHFTSEEAARAAFENSMAGEEFKTVKKAPTAPKRKPEWPDIEVYRDFIKADTEVYVHPQGKIAFVNRFGSLYVMKNGKKATTSGTVADLRAGRGAWQLAKDRRVATAPTAAEYRATFSNEVNGAEKEDSTTEIKKTTTRRPRSPKALTPEQDRLVAAGYPATSSLNPDRPVPIHAGAPRIAPQSNYYGSSGAAAILPISARGNPHKLREMVTGDKLRHWNSIDSKTGEETADTVIEVWSNSEGNYKAVATSGVSMPLGSEQPFRHDQTFSRMGHKWTLVGAFEPIDGGGVIGEVPDKSMPIYTYK